MKNKLSETVFVLLFCIIFGYLFAIDKVQYFINPNYYWWILGALIVTTLYAVLSLVWCIRSYHSLKLPTKLSLYGLLLLTLLLFTSIFVVPLKPLNSQSLVFANTSRIIPGKNLSQKPIKFSQNAVTNLTIREWQIAQKNSPNLSSFEGQATGLKGIVIKNNGDSFVLGQFQVSCCVSDAQLYTITVKGLYENAIQDTWVDVSGKLSIEGKKPKSELVLQAETVTTIPIPRNPYF